MGYYLGVSVNGEWIDPDIGGKFFGYLDNNELESCESYKFLQGKVQEPELLNVFWCCFSFELSLNDAIIFLHLYEEDFNRIDGREWEGVEWIITALKQTKADRILFEMG